ncbi:ABC transporter ATP-binding protein [Lacticaseibacillus daqingensis]|uniref:ABC transporter ATP-binding protein n=1 Tax=Lacticaseibacillus daqingensis TaxID=2486014 RepID=UPI000F77A070|nr:ABC transporter ATP-binding protein [Lacticaseibacillus daqingensis]
MLTFKQVTKAYGDQRALDAVSLTIASHELFVLVGPSGSGKTTLLKMINRLNTPTSGQILIDDSDVAAVTDVRALRRRIGYVLQGGALFPNMTVAQNVAVPLATLGWSQAAQTARVTELLTQVGLSPERFLTRKPSELSGGEAQRVGIIRALAAKPDIILMDEPFSALDPLSRTQLQALVRQLHAALKTTIVFVTHDMDEALALADRLAVMHAGQLQQVGTPAELLGAPANDFVAQFFAGARDAQQYLRQVIAAGFGHPGTGEQALAPTATLQAWAQVLRQTPTQAVQVGPTVLEPADLIAYLASTKEVRA